jgi:glucosamine-6-phosphate deaminase
LKVRVHRSAEDLAGALAHETAAAIDRRPDLTLGLPAGRTPILLYRELARISHERPLDWSCVKTFGIDELVTPPGDRPQPYAQFLQDHLLSLLNLQPAHINSLDGRADDVAAECDRYERAIAAAGGLDLVILGIGVNGHIGFNEPAPALEARTHLVTLSADSRDANAWLFEDQPEKAPTTALSMGMATILGARSIVVMATSALKAAAVAAMVNGGVTTTVPASFLQLHADVTILLDGPAAAGITHVVATD